MGHVQSIGNEGIPVCSLGNQLNAAVAYGSSSSHSSVPSVENLRMQSLMNLCDDSSFPLA